MKNFTPKLLLTLLLATSLNAFAQVPKLNSLASASATMFLDFDGHTVKSYAWNGNNTFVCAASGMTTAQITEIFNRVSEDYRPFNINITTDSTKFIAAPVAQRVRIIVTPTSGWYQGVGGISYIGSFTWGDDVPGFVFTDRLLNNPKYIAECCSHEGGHTVGLSHQSTYDTNCNLTETYALGSGSGETGWSPIMGNSYYQNMTGWNDGPTPYGCALTQDNLTIITTTNGFGYRNDDYTGTLDNTTYSLGTNNFTATGVITTATDLDAFKFVISQNSTFHLEVKPNGVNGSEEAANLDAKVQLYNSSKVLINTFNPLEALDVVKDTSLSAGTYYLVVSGVGNANTSEYGSLGGYTLRGTTGVLAIKEIALSGTANDNKHTLNWKVTADEPMRTQTIEVSEDGRNFKTLVNVGSTSNTYTYAPMQEGTLYYRIKVVSVIDQVAYSNIITLKSNGVKDKMFIVSSFVQQNIMVNASDKYQYKLMDINGKTIALGTGIKGINSINLQRQPAGMYVLQLLNDNYKQTERIIKQ
ncbi:T9SS type A sorting domain-containing protein [Ferruginibacter sp. HRS2-29]|uniref:T9SS type A sorting domain-containing protein n=1 Tax=Ferruginibacter sp. HRS2-29 TaxID=2487334 RepID=UPI0020CF8250|nr:T9SS type A sorting domain-containing protein [Ferruginibacter sp. HRS2-29]MCP9752157.1 T9SS C-terminal target domain-containing protein [Ferruginibacter sp. HRS2-29]